MKKRVLSLLLVLMMVLSLVPTMALAEDDIVAYAVTGGNIYFDKSTGTITDCDDSVTEAVIPAEIEGAPVTSIGEWAFSGCTGLTSIEIPNSVTSIGGFAFQGCTGLTSITITNRVTSIGNRAFQSCTGLKKIDIPDSVTSIGYEAFWGCTGLTSITIPDSVTSISWGIFRDCTGLTSITIPNSVTSIGSGAFSGCTSLTSVAIPDSVTSIGGGAFSGCTSLESINIDSGYWGSIYSYAFQGCTSLETVNMVSCRSISEYAFQGCTVLKNLTLPSNLQTIGQFAFEKCTSLETLTIPGNVSEIGNSTFSGCTALKSVSLPLSLKTVGNAAFRYCSSLADVYYEGDSVQWGEISIAPYNEPLTGATLHQKEHVHSFGNPVFTAPNCTEQGFTTYTCKCGETKTDNYVDALDHVYKNGVCSRCGEREAHTHDFVETVTAPTCTEAGYTTYTCSCGESYTKNYVNALGHTPETVNAEPATCTDPGYTGDEVCTICGDVISQGEVIKAPGHTEVIDEAVAPTCTETGLTEGKHCSVCNEIIVAQEEVEATGHHFEGNTCPDCGATRSTADTIRAFFQTSFNNFKSFFDKLFGR